MTPLPDYTISGDAVPQWTESTGPYGAVVAHQDQYALARPPLVRNHALAEMWKQDAARRRYGAYGIRCTSFRDGYDPFNAKALEMHVAWYLGGGGRKDHVLVEGDEEHDGWSWWFPADYRGSAPDANWCNIYEFGSGTNKHPRNGSGFDAPDANRLTLTFHNGQTANPGQNGAGGLTFNGTYNACETLLGTGAKLPFAKGVWLDFYKHTVYRARSNGLFELWYRKEGDAAFTKLYSNKNDGSALINRPPHPTWYYNAAWGVPGSTVGGVVSDGAVAYAYRVYRSATHNDHDVVYWADGFRRRQSMAAILSGFA